MLVTVTIALVSYWAFCAWYTIRGTLHYIRACRVCDTLAGPKMVAPYKISWDAFRLPRVHSRMQDVRFLTRSLVVAPVRFGGFVGSAVFLCVLILIFPKRHAQCISMYMNRIILAVLGLSLEVEGKPVSGKQAPLLVSNHVGMMDIIILLSIEKLSFFSDNGIRKFYIIGPIWGYIADAIGCVFVSRSSDSSRAEAKIALLNRMQEISLEKMSSRLVVFPEGTTSNGEGVLAFKTGAFENMQPVQPVILNYEDKQWGYCSVWSDVYFGYIMALPPSKVRVKFLDPMGPCESESVLDFTNRVRLEMIKQSNGLKDFASNENPTRSHIHISNIILALMQ